MSTSLVSMRLAIGIQSPGLGRDLRAPADEPRDQVERHDDDYQGQGGAPQAVRGVVGDGGTGHLLTGHRIEVICARSRRRGIYVGELIFDQTRQRSLEPVEEV